jgi:hypothetical protein
MSRSRAQIESAIGFSGTFDQERSFEPAAAAGRTRHHKG